MTTCTNPPSHVDPSEPDPPDLIFTRENVDSLASEIGVFDEQKIEDLHYQLTTAAYWHIYGVWDEKHTPKMTRSKLKIIENKSNDLLKQLENIDDHTKASLATGFRRCRRRKDPRVRYIDQRLVIGAWLTVGVVRDLVDLLHEATQRAIEVTPRGDGRPRSQALRQACFAIAQVYEDFSGKQFTREKGKGVWTESARWVAKVARMLTPEGERSPTESELNTAMRYVVRDLRDRPYVPWLDEDAAGSESLQEPPG